MKFWIFLHNLLEKLTAEGMSSDETEFEQETMQRVFRVKVLFWRRDISEYLAMIDSLRDDPEFFSTRGSRGVRRLTKRDESRRSPTKSLPRVLYDDSWFEEVDERRRSLMLRVSKAEFKWLEMEDQMNNWN